MQNKLNCIKVRFSATFVISSEISLISLKDASDFTFFSLARQTAEPSDRCGRWKENIFTPTGQNKTTATEW